MSQLQRHEHNVVCVISQDPVQVWGVYRHSETEENCRIGQKWRRSRRRDVTSVVTMNTRIETAFTTQNIIRG